MLVREEDMQAICVAEQLPISNKRPCTINGLSFFSGSIISFEEEREVLKICLGDKNTIQIYGIRDTTRQKLFVNRMKLVEQRQTDK